MAVCVCMCVHLSTYLKKLKGEYAVPFLKPVLKHCLGLLFLCSDKSLPKECNFKNCSNKYNFISLLFCIIIVADLSDNF